TAAADDDDVPHGLLHASILRRAMIKRQSCLPEQQRTRMTDDPAEPPIDRMLDGVAGRLRALRTRRGLTLAELSEETGISVSTLSRLESGGRRPHLALLTRIARVYRASLDDLVGAPQIADPRVAPRPFYRGG